MYKNMFNLHIVHCLISLLLGSDKRLNERKTYNFFCHPLVKVCVFEAQNNRFIEMVLRHMFRLREKINF